MGLDIKIPIGLMFSILGIILTVHGIVTGGNTEMYEQSLGLYISFQKQGWQRRIQMPPSIQIDNAAGQRANITWGTPTRKATRNAEAGAV